MTAPKVSSSEGSTAIGGDSNAPVVNVNADQGANVQVTIEQHLARQLPSFLGKVIVLFSQQSLGEYGLGERRTLPPEVTEKLVFNNLPKDHKIFTDYYKHIEVLEKSYSGVEQLNPDARYLVRRRARIRYEEQLAIACEKASLGNTDIEKIDKCAYAITNSCKLIDAVISRLLQDYVHSQSVMVEEETADLAVSLIVADAVVECEVMERPKHVATA